MGEDVVVSATIDDTQKGNSNIKSAECSIDGMEWIAMSASDGSFNSPIENVTATLSTHQLDCGPHVVYVRGTDIKDNMSSGEHFTGFELYELGSISGAVYYEGEGVSVVVKLTKLDGETIEWVETITSAPNSGHYKFDRPHSK